MAAKLSCRLTSATAWGLCARSSARAAPREVRLSSSRRARGASSSTACMKAARSTGASAPVSSVKSPTRGRPSRARRRSSWTSSPSMPASTLTWKPDTETTW